MRAGTAVQDSPPSAAIYGFGFLYLAGSMIDAAVRTSTYGTRFAQDGLSAAWAFAFALGAGAFFWFAWRLLGNRVPNGLACFEDDLSDGAETS